MATKKSTQPANAARVDVESLPVEIRDRLNLVRIAGLQIAALTDALQAPIKRMHRVEHYAEETIVSLLLERLETIALVVEDLGCPEDDTGDQLDTLQGALSLGLELP